jgi:hypothetical protein
MYIASVDKDAPTYSLGPDFYDRLNVFVDRLLADGFEYFAPEFAKVDAFVENALHESTDRDAHELRTTPKSKYLLEVISFCLYDRLNREAFNRAADTIIILPDCLSLHNPDCLKTDEKWGDRCQACTPDCQAALVDEIAGRYGVEVVFSKRKLEDQIEHYSERSGDLGVVGIGCVLMLASGMRTAARVGVPARGVLLDFCGCEHWNDQPRASAFPIERLEAILKEKYG